MVDPMVYNILFVTITYILSVTIVTLVRESGDTAVEENKLSCSVYIISHLTKLFSRFSLLKHFVQIQRA